MGDTEVPSEEISDGEMERMEERLLEGEGYVMGEDFLLPPTDPLVLPDFASLDTHTRHRLSALLQAAGISKGGEEGKNLFADPDVLRRLTSSVSCALDEAANALTRMKTSPDAPAATPSASFTPLAMNSQSCAVAAAQQQAAFQALQNNPKYGMNPADWEPMVLAHVAPGTQNLPPNSLNNCDPGAAEEGESLLSLACSAGYYELAQVLLAMRTNVEDRGSKGDCTPLMEAASAGHADIVKLLVAHGADVNAQSSTGNTPLMYACAGGHESVVGALLGAKADVEIRNENGHSPLMEAASAGHVSIAKDLVQNGAILQSQNSEFKVGLESPLTLACYKGHIEMVRFLLSVGPRSSHRQEELYTALMEASMDGHLEVARLLLDNGAPVNLASDSFESPLTLAACGGHLDLVRLLLDRGAQIEDPNDEGYTPLMEAAREGHEDVVELLLDRGADVNAQTEETGETALTLAACGGFKEVVVLLVERGADLDLGANTPLMEASQEGHFETVKYLIKATLDQGDISIDASTATGDTALTYAAENGHTDVCVAILAAGADLEHEADGGRTALMKAAKSGHDCTCQFLISKGAQVNKTTLNYDHSALSLGCGNGHYEVTELLLAHGANPKQKLKDSSTCIIEAAKGGHTGIVQLLLDWPGVQLPTFTAQPPTLQQLAVTAAALPPSFLPSQTPPSATLSDNKSQTILPTVPPQSLSGGSQTPLVVQPVPSFLGMTGATSQQPLPNLQNPPVSAFNLPVDPQFLATLQQQQNRIVNGGPPVTPSVCLDPNQNAGLASANLPLAEQREWLLLQAQRALMKQAGDKLAPQELNQLNEILKAQFRQMFPTSPTPTPQPPPTPPQQTTPGGKRKNIQSTLPTTTQPQPSSGLKAAMDEMKQLQDDQDKPKTEKAKEAGKNQGTQTTLSLQELKSGGVAVEEQVVMEKRASQQAQQHIVFPPGNGGGFDFQLPPPPPPQHPRPLPPPSDASPQPQPHYATPSTPHESQTASIGNVPAPGKANAETQATLVPPPGKAGGAASVDLNTQTESNHDTALTLACAGGHEELVSLLIQRGADTEHKDKKGFTPLILAATAGHHGVVEQLLNSGANIEAQSERTKDTALSLACSGGRKEVVEILLKRGANKEHRNVSDYTPLSLAASGGYVDIIQLLLNYGAEINSRTGSKLGISPLMLAAMNGHTQAVKLLLERGSDINAQIETNRNTALTLACFQGRHEVVKLLLDYRANLEHRAKTGLTPLMEAASGGYVEVGRVLLHYGADPNASPVPSSRDTALTIASDKGHHKFVDLLLHHGAGVDSRNKKGCTSLWLSCHGGHLETVQTLVKHKADVDAQDNRKVTPLMAAFRRGHLKVVKWLVRHVQQFPSDQECQRFIATITDKELLVKCRQCMDVVVAAKDRQAAEANKAAATLLQELELEEKAAENKRQTKERQKAKKKAKRQAKKAAQKGGEEGSKKEEDGGSEEEGVVGGEEGVKESPPPSAPAPKAEPEDDNLEEEEEEEEVRVEMMINTKAMRAMNHMKDMHKEEIRPQSPEEDARVPTHPAPEEPAPSYGAEQKRTFLRDQRVPGGRSNRHNRRTPGTKTTTGLVESSLRAPMASQKRISPLPNKREMEEAEWNKPSRKGARRKGEVGSLRGVNGNHPEDPFMQANGAAAAAAWREVRRRANKLVVSSQQIARVIGRGGQNINAIREATGAHIEVEKQQPKKEQQDRQITIRGSADATRQAVLMINGLQQDPDAPVADIIRKFQMKPRDKLSMEPFPGQPAPTPLGGVITTVTASSMGHQRQHSDGSASAGSGSKIVGGGQKKSFPEVTLWVPSSGSAQYGQQGQYQSGALSHKKATVGGAPTTKSGSAPSSRPSPPGQKSELSPVPGGTSTGAGEFSPFQTPNVWEKGGTRFESANAPRRNFASVVAASTATKTASSSVSSSISGDISIVSQQRHSGTVGQKEQTAASMERPQSAQQSVSDRGADQRKAPGYRRGAVTPAPHPGYGATPSGGSSITPPSVSSLSPPALSMPTSSPISFGVDPILSQTSSTFTSNYGGSKSAYASPAPTKFDIISSNAHNPPSTPSNLLQSLNQNADYEAKGRNEVVMAPISLPSTDNRPASAFGRIDGPLSSTCGAALRSSPRQEHETGSGFGPQPIFSNAHFHSTTAPTASVPLPSNFPLPHGSAASWESAGGGMGTGFGMGNPSGWTSMGEAGMGGLAPATDSIGSLSANLAQLQMNSNVPDTKPKEEEWNRVSQPMNNPLNGIDFGGLGPALFPHGIGGFEQGGLQGNIFHNFNPTGNNPNVGDNKLFETAAKNLLNMFMKSPAPQAQSQHQQQQQHHQPQQQQPQLPPHSAAYHQQSYGEPPPQPQSHQNKFNPFGNQVDPNRATLPPQPHNTQVPFNFDMSATQRQPPGFFHPSVTENTGAVPLYGGFPGSDPLSGPPPNGPMPPFSNPPYVPPQFPPPPLGANHNWGWGDFDGTANTKPPSGNVANHLLMPNNGTSGSNPWDGWNPMAM